MTAAEAIKRLAWTDPEVHPAAAKLPMMNNDELTALSEDIRVNGLQHPIILLRDNTGEQFGKSGPFPIFLLDGRNRLAAMKLAGITDPRKAKNGRIISETVRILNRYEKRSMMGSNAARDLWVEEVNPTTFVLSANVRRRHLTTKQKREAIAAFIAADPIASDRKVARALDVDNKTVASVRGGQNEEIPQTDHQPSARAREAWLANPTASQRQIAKDSKVGTGTVVSVRRQLVAEGLLQPIPQRGGTNKKKPKGEEVVASPVPRQQTSTNTLSQVERAKNAIEKAIGHYGEGAVLEAIQQIFNK